MENRNVLFDELESLEKNFEKKIAPIVQELWDTYCVVKPEKREIYGKGEIEQKRLFVLFVISKVFSNAIHSCSSFSRGYVVDGVHSYIDH